MTRNGQVELSDLDGEHDLGLLELVGAKAFPELPLSAEQLTAVRRDLALEVVAEASPMQERRPGCGWNADQRQMVGARC